MILIIGIAACGWYILRSILDHRAANRHMSSLEYINRCEWREGDRG